MKNKLEAH